MLRDQDLIGASSDARQAYEDAKTLGWELERRETAWRRSEGEDDVAARVEATLLFERTLRLYERAVGIWIRLAAAADGLAPCTEEPAPAGLGALARPLMALCLRTDRFLNEWLANGSGTGDEQAEAAVLAADIEGMLARLRSLGHR